MKISEYIALLSKIREAHGDLEVKTQTLSHTWTAEPPELRPCDYSSTRTPWVLLNP